MQECYAFDIDGVIADVSDRLRVALRVSGSKSEKFWEIFFDPNLIIRLDKPRDIGVKLVRERARRGCIIVITGRPMRLRDISLQEFLRFTGVRPRAIFMRRDGDYRPSSIVKTYLVGLAMRYGFEILEFHDDDEEVLRSLRDKYPEITLIHHFNNKFRVIT